MNALDGKRAIVTGAGSGLGQEIACLFALEGAFVYGTDRDADGLAQTRALAGEGQFEALEHDVTDEGSWAGVLKSAFEAGPCDILVNSAGVVTFGSFETMTLSQFQAVNDVNLNGPFMGMKLFVERLRAGAEGQPLHASIINLTSIASSRTGPGWTAYSASKYAFKNLTKALAVELGLDGDFIRVNAIAPGPIRTPMTEDTMDVPWEERDHKPMLRNIPLKRYGLKEEVAKAALYLASERSKFMTGQSIEVDGGWGGI